MGVDIKGVYISKENLPGDLLSNLESVTVNAGSAFLAGEAANLLKKPANIVSNSLKIYNSVTDLEKLKKISIGLVEHSATVMTNELTSYLTDRTTELLSFKKMGDALMESSAYWLKVYTKSPAEILEMINPKKVDDTNRKQSEEEKNKKLEEIKEKATKCYGTCKDYVEKTVGSLDAGISTIAAYVSLGPDWVVTQVNSYVSQAITKAEGFIGSYVDLAIRARDTAIDTLGNGIGAMGAEVVNKIAETAAKKLKTAAEESIMVQFNKAQGMVISLLMKLRELTGIAVPVPNIPLPKLF